MVSKVIAQSGSALADWAMIVDRYRAQNTSRVYAEMMGCSIESSWKLVQCLKDGRSFLDLGNSELQPHVGSFPWAPVLDVNFTVPYGYYDDWRPSDWHFFSGTAEDSIKMRNFSTNLVYMAGVTTQEAAYMLCKLTHANRYIIISFEFKLHINTLHVFCTFTRYTFFIHLCLHDKYFPQVYTFTFARSRLNFCYTFEF